MGKHAPTPEGLTRAEQRFVDTFRKYAMEYSTTAEVLRAVARELNLGKKTANSYRYSHARIKAILVNVPMTGKKFEDESKKAIDWTVNEIIAQYEKILAVIPETDTKERRAVIDSIKGTIKDFGEKFNTDIQALKNMTMEQLLDKTQEVAGKLYGNKRIGEILRGVLERQGG